jgi:hypothetical protein
MDIERAVTDIVGRLEKSLDVNLEGLGALQNTVTELLATLAN